MSVLSASNQRLKNPFHSLRPPRTPTPSRASHFCTPFALLPSVEAHRAKNGLRPSLRLISSFIIPDQRLISVSSAVKKPHPIHCELPNSTPSGISHFGSLFVPLCGQPLRLNTSFNLRPLCLSASLPLCPSAAKTNLPAPSPTPPHPPPKPLSKTQDPNPESDIF